MSDAKWCPSMALTWVQAFGIPGGMQLRSLSQWLIIQTISNSTTIAAIAPPHIETPNPVLTLLSVDSSKFTSCFWRTPEFRNIEHTRAFFIWGAYAYTNLRYVYISINIYIHTRRYHPNNPNTTPSNEESPPNVAASGWRASCQRPPWWRNYQMVRAIPSGNEERPPPHLLKL